MSILDSLFRRRDGSASAAKTRLLKVLVDDRYKLTPEMMAQLKVDLAEVFARYLPSVDPDAIEVTLQRGESNDHLKADIPLRRTPNT
ncbi:MAG TPA: cell division topological specificity factor MinE [Roseiflexaceae bacterium]|nr:cell division topological specificity factor MinE [Roseiflexaceae bacterium]